MPESSQPEDHVALVARLRASIEAPAGSMSPQLRRAAAARAAGGTALPAPYDDLARQIEEASYRLTDADVARVREAAGSDKAAFELVMAAAIGAGLMRWDRAVRAIGEATDAPV